MIGSSSRKDVGKMRARGTLKEGKLDKQNTKNREY